jgi:hypothetical protein
VYFQIKARLSQGTENSKLVLIIVIITKNSSMDSLGRYCIILLSSSLDLYTVKKRLMEIRYVMEIFRFHYWRIPSEAVNKNDHLPHWFYPSEEVDIAFQYLWWIFPTKCF